MMGVLSATILALVIWAWMDYRNWIALGAGGLPSNPYGWSQVTWMRLGKHDPLSTSVFEKNIGKDWDVRGLGDLPKRAGTRPQVDPHPIPHRQTDQFGDEQVRREQKQIFDDVIAENAALLYYQKSIFERHNDAVFLREPAKGNSNTKAQGEVGHIHPSDGSMHMTLSPSDAKKVIGAGWGELHPLTEETGRLPSTYMMIYSPRSQEENAVVEQILRAAVKFAVGNPQK